MPRRRRGLSDHGGYQELSGTKKRYRLVNHNCVLRCLGRRRDQLEEFRSWYEATLADKLAAGYQVREPFWTEAFAVGDRSWVEAMHAKFDFTHKKIQAADPAGDLMIGEQASAYYFKG